MTQYYVKGDDLVYVQYDVPNGHSIEEFVGHVQKTDTVRIDDDTVEDIVSSFDFEKGEYVEQSRGQRYDPLYSLDELKEKKLAEIQAAHDAELYTSFVSSALGSPKTYNYSQKAAERFQAWLTVVNASQSIQTVNWYTLEDGEVTHTRDQFIQVCLDGAMRANAIEHKQIQLSDQVKAAQTPDEVRAISW